MTRASAASDTMLRKLREHGLRYPGAHLKSPWPGHLDLAVNDKTFCYLSIEGEPFAVSCKLPESAEAALGLPFTQPTAYGLGKSGWVSASFEEHPLPPFELFAAWLDESYRAQAPKRLIRELDARGPCGERPSRAAARTPTAAPKKPAPKTPAPKTPAPKTPAPKTPAPKKPAPKKPAPKKPAPRRAAPKKAGR